MKLGLNFSTKISFLLAILIFLLLSSGKPDSFIVSNFCYCEFNIIKKRDLWFFLSQVSVLKAMERFDSKVDFKVIEFDFNYLGSFLLAVKKNLF